MKLPAKLALARRRRRWVRRRHKQNDRCDYCGNRTALPDDGVKHGKDTLYATCDHRTPLSKGGTEDWENYALACHVCNELKASMTEKQYRQLLRRAGLHATTSARRRGE